MDFNNMTPQARMKLQKDDKFCRVIGELLELIELTEEMTAKKIDKERGFTWLGQNFYIPAGQRVDEICVHVGPRIYNAGKDYGNVIISGQVEFQVTSEEYLHWKRIN